MALRSEMALPKPQVTLTLGVGSLARPMDAATFTWNGVGADANRSMAANWAGDAAPVSDGTADL